MPTLTGNGLETHTFPSRRIIERAIDLRVHHYNTRRSPARAESRGIGRIVLGRWEEYEATQVHTYPYTRPRKDTLLHQISQTLDRRTWTTATSASARTHDAAIDTDRLSSSERTYKKGSDSEVYGPMRASDQFSSVGITGSSTVTISTTVTSTLGFEFEASSPPEAFVDHILDIASVLVQRHPQHTPHVRSRTGLGVVFARQANSESLAKK
ncbi:hypothetical protein BJV77DRAFT_1153546 [Russula vinacea]|nr:hypothetical protein BJV77DRAFT_1153546 [Russula vinacea]